MRKTILFMHDVMDLWRRVEKIDIQNTEQNNQISHGVASAVKCHIRLFSFASSSYDRKKIHGTVLHDTGLAGFVLIPQCYSTPNPSFFQYLILGVSLLMHNMTKVL